MQEPCTSFFGSLVTNCLGSEEPDALITTNARSRRRAGELASTLKGAHLRKRMTKHKVLASL